MWLEEDISGFFSLFELKKEVLDSLLSQKYSKNDLDQFSEIEYQNILRDDVATARIMHMLWNHFCSYRHCAKDALVAVKETMIIWSRFCLRNSSVEVFDEPLPSKDRLLEESEKVADHYADMKNIIDEQQQKIQTLEDRELDYRDELNRRERLILDLQNQMILLQDEFDSATKQLKVFAEVVDEAHSQLAEESDKLRTLYSESSNTIQSLHQAYLETNQMNDRVKMKYFTSVDGIPTLPILSINKLTCQNLPLPSINEAHSTSPYIVISLRDGGTQTDQLIGAKPGATIEWIPANPVSVTSCILVDDLISVELWNQYTIHEAHLVARAQGRIVPLEQISTWNEGHDCECEISLTFVDDKSNPLKGSVTLNYTLKNNLYSCATTCTSNAATSQPIPNPMMDYVKTRELALSITSASEDTYVVHFLSSWRLLMEMIVAAQHECHEVINSSEIVVRAQTSLSEKLSTSVEMSEQQLNGMRKYACSLHPLVEKLRTEKSYMDMLKESETKYESLISELRTNYSELEEKWGNKYNELESLSQLRLDQYISESQSRYTTLMESSNKAYADLREAYETERIEVLSLKDQLSESFGRYEKLKVSYEEVCRRLETELHALAGAKTKISSLELELEEIIEIVRKDMAHRCISKNAAEDLLTLSSQMISKEPNSKASIDIFLHQFDWQSIHHQLSMNMSEQQVIELKNTLATVKSSYDILCSRLFLECQARVELEKVLEGTKDDLGSIKLQILSEVKIRQQLEEELRFAKELAANESKFALVAKKAAEDAIKQARYFQRKLNKEIDHIRDNISGTDVIGDLSLTLPDDASEIIDDEPAANSPNRKPGRPKSAGSRGFNNFEDKFYANLVLTPEGKSKRKSENGSISIQGRSKLVELDDSPYSEHLSPRSRKALQRGEHSPHNRSMNSAPGYRKSYSNNGLHTSSESGLERNKKGKKISSMGKKFIKKVQKSLGTRSKSNSTVAPFVDSDEVNRKVSKPDWIDPNTKDYSKSKG